MPLNKDEILNSLATTSNVAQFVSFRPDQAAILEQSFCRITGYEENHRFSSARDAVVALLASSTDKMVNIRSYEPQSPRSREFVYGLSSVEVVLGELQRLSKEGLHLIVNETIDVGDGGVSGVAHGHLLEFSPDDTPRCVEKPGVASLPLALGMRVLTTVYGFTPDLSLATNGRVEFSIHPKPRGYRQRHTIVWEYERDSADFADSSIVWPNRFSRHLGDKVFGLLIADALGLPVPKTTVISRRIAPFSFGKDTGSPEVWTRTSPEEPQPGLYTTVKGWIDPFYLLGKEDPEGSRIRSVLCQSAVRAKHSGAAIMGASGVLIVDGRSGEGDGFMLGIDSPEVLPQAVIESVGATYAVLASRLGPVRFEWVHDGDVVWIVQLHCGATASEADKIVPGEASSWVEFRASAGLEALRDLLSSISAGQGIMVVGSVGLTSHIADLLRKARFPARVKPQGQDS